LFPVLTEALRQGVQIETQVLDAAGLPRFAALGEIAFRGR